MTLTSLRLEVGNAMHDDMMQEQGFVVDLDVSREQATEVLHIPVGESARSECCSCVFPSVRLCHDV